MSDSTDHGTDRDVLDALSTDHAEARELFEQIVTTTDPASRRQLTDRLIGELVRHSVAEEMLESADAAAPEFLETLGRMRAVFEHHVSAEEGAHFPGLRAHVPADVLVAFKGKVETAEKLAPTRPHPAAPNAELFHKTVGLVDRLRDRFTGRSV